MRAYALCIIAGHRRRDLVGERRWMAARRHEGHRVDIAVFAVPFGLIGGRLYHVSPTPAVLR